MPDVCIRLQTAGLQLEFQGSEAFYDRLLASILAPLVGQPADGAPAPSAQASPAAPAAGRPLASRASRYQPPSDRFGTFRRQIDLSKDGEAERVAAFAFYLWNYEKKETFREEEVEGCYHAQGLPPPADPASVYGDLLTRRLLTPGAAERSWKLTGKGRDYVRHHLLSA